MGQKYIDLKKMFMWLKILKLCQWFTINVLNSSYDLSTPMKIKKQTIVYCTQTNFT